MFTILNDTIMGKQMNVILVASAVLVFLVGLDLNAGITMNIILKSAQPKVCIFIANSPPSRRKHTLWQPRAVLLPIHMDRTKLQQQQHFPRSHLWRHHWRTWHRSMRSTPARDRSVYKSKFILCTYTVSRFSLPVTKCPALCFCVSFTDNGQSPNTSWIWDSHARSNVADIACRLSPSDVCVKYTYKYNNAGKCCWRWRSAICFC